MAMKKHLSKTVKSKTPVTEKRTRKVYDEYTQNDFDGANSYKTLPTNLIIDNINNAKTFDNRKSSKISLLNPERDTTPRLKLDI